MRIWGNIKVNDIVLYNKEKYIVEKIYKEGLTTYGIIKNIETEKKCNVPLYYCRPLEEEVFE